MCAFNTLFNLPTAEAQLALLQQVAQVLVPGGAFVIEVEASAWNCPKHITPRITVPEVETIVAGLQQRITDLEAQLAERTRHE